MLAVTAAGNKYVQHKAACVNGCNLLLFRGKTVPECMRLCDQHEQCLGFEYGVALGERDGGYAPGSCQLQSCGEVDDKCDGYYHNLVRLVFAWSTSADAQPAVRYLGAQGGLLTNQDPRPTSYVRY